MRYWSILFILMAIAVTGVYIYAPIAGGDWWLPENISAKGTLAFGAEVDHLFVMILWITGIVFVGTQVALGYVMWKYQARPGHKATYFHGSQRLEVIWTIIPSAILVFIALYQMGTWSNIKFRTSQPKVKPIAEVTARQFQWLMRYAGEDQKMNTPDDVHVINDLHFVKGTPVVIHLHSADVLHSFFLPQFRIKQDAVPGLTIPVWFDADKAGTYDIVCAELCGWGHYKMRGKVTVHDTQQEYDDWMRTAYRNQSASQISMAESPKGSE